MPDQLLVDPPRLLQLSTLFLAEADDLDQVIARFGQYATLEGAYGDLPESQQASAHYRAGALEMLKELHRVGAEFKSVADGLKAAAASFDSAEQEAVVIVSADHEAVTSASVGRRAPAPATARKKTPARTSARKRAAAPAPAEQEATAEGTATGYATA
jgi:hypothetical protein